MRFDREGRRPDGSTVKVGFSLTFADDKAASDIRFATCQQHYPENFWNPAFQKHENGVERVDSVVLVADVPADHRRFLLTLTGADRTRDTDSGFVIDLPRGAIEVMTPTDYAGRFGADAPDTTRGARLAALRFSGAKVAPRRDSALGAFLLLRSAG